MPTTDPEKLREKRRRKRKTVAGAARRRRWRQEYNTPYKTYRVSGATRGSWYSMRTRCLNRKHRDFGKRGMTICARWLDSYANFVEDMGERPPGTTLDRIDKSKGFCKENCRWKKPSWAAD